METFKVGDLVRHKKIEDRDNYGVGLVTEINAPHPFGYAIQRSQPETRNVRVKVNFNTLGEPITIHGGYLEHV